MPASIAALFAGLPIDENFALVLAAMTVSLGASMITLVYNRRSISEPVDDSDGDIGALFESPASIVPHLVELRQRLVYALIGIVVATVIAGALTNTIIEILTEPVVTVLQQQFGEDINVTILDPTEGVTVFIRVAITTGIVFASPYVIAQVWIFIAAGLKPSERRMFYLLFPFAAGLFITGVAFAYFVMLPVALPFLYTFLDPVEPIVRIDSFIRFVTTVLLFVGLSFEMPLIFFVLAKLGVVNSKMLAQNWRIAVVLIAVLAALITPTPDPINMGIVAAPLILLYLLSIVLTRFANPPNRAEA
ncbi:MAG: twin-arginine translocase subunit TatC [Anaerolineae bacterium]